MLNIFFYLFSMLYGGQTDYSQLLNKGPMDYPKMWKEIDSLEQKGLPKSALEKTEILYATALRDKVQPQQIRALFYLAKYTQDLEEEGMVKAVNRLIKAEATMDAPGKYILRSILAETYASYFNQNQWKLRDLTETIEEPTDDFTTWTGGQWIEKIRNTYLSSIDISLQQVPIDVYKEILAQGDSDKLRPTLYDLLLHRAISYFMEDSRFLDQPVYAFSMNDPQLLAPEKEFIQLPLATEDESSGIWMALKLFQQGLAFRMQDKKANATLDIDLLRLRFVYSHATFDQKKERYLNALLDLSKKYEGQAGDAEIQHQIAQWHKEEGDQYQIGENPKVRNEYKLAHDICQAVIKKYPDAYGTQFCKQLNYELEQQTLSLSLEGVFVPNKEQIFSINYRNTASVQVDIIAMTTSEYKTAQSYDQDKIKKLIKGKKAIKKWNLDLPETSDFQTHMTEQALPKLAAGAYLLKIESVTGTKPVFISSFQVSKLAVFQRTGISGMELYVVDRGDGKPKEGVVAHYMSYENRWNRESTPMKVGSSVSDKNGKLSSLPPPNTSFSLELVAEGQTLILQEYLYNNGGRDGQSTSAQVHFFLDRKIYRPGQTLYFKGYVIQQNGRQWPVVLKNSKVVVQLLDANGQLVQKTSFVSNGYGTFSGTFVLPSSGLTGNFTLRTEQQGGSAYGYSTFKVEEYKRPTFEVVLDTVKESVKLGDSITFKGTAMTYSGVPLNDAMVRYTVNRTQYVPWFYWGYFRRFPSSNASTVIVQGTTKTDDKGQFTVPFRALAEPGADKTGNLDYNFEVNVDVVDISGETHSRNRSITIGNQPYQVSMASGQSIDIADKDSIVLNSTNSEGIPLAITGTIKISKLKAPNDVKIDRKWSQPDVWSMPETEFRNLFPDITWKEENDPAKYAVEKILDKITWNTGEEIGIKTQQWTAGLYRIEVESQDKEGNKAKHQFYKEITNRENKSAAPLAALIISGNNEPLEPGQTAILFAGSNFENQKALLEIDRKDQPTILKWIDLDHWDKTSMAITESDRGNLYYKICFMRNNRFYQQSEVVKVPWTNKELNVSFETFRDHLLPGQEETWTLRIKGNGKEKIATELLASMYDASLDAFAPNKWNWSLAPTYGGKGSFRLFSEMMANGVFQSTESEYVSLPFIPRTYPTLNWFGWYVSSYGGGYRGEVMYEMSAPSSNDMVKRQSANAPVMAKSLAGKAAGLDEKDSTTESPAEPKVEEIAVRKNLKEPVFFFPDLYTDAEGNVVIKFTMNEALTKWKLQLLATTKELDYGFAEKSVITSKQLMVVPNAPRFLRSGDAFTWAGKVQNQSKDLLKGTVRLELYDAITLKPVDNLFSLKDASQSFTCEAGKSIPITWNIKVPNESVQAVTFRMVATAANLSDGEENSLPVVSNRSLVTENMPMNLRAKETKSFDFKSLSTNQSTTLTNEALTLEWTANPAWYVVQALPYMMEYPFDCAEQVFNKFYANALAFHVTKSTPKINRIFESWKGTAALESNLSKNQELKNALLEETPWVMQAQSEDQQKKQIALLFDLNKMNHELSSSLKQLAEKQEADGGFSWFKGGPRNWYITQYIVEGIGHLDHLSALPKDNNGTEIDQILGKGLKYCDLEMEKYYRDLEKSVKEKKTTWEENHLSPLVCHYLYTRSLFPNRALSNKAGKEIQDYWLSQAKKYWLSQDIYQQGMLGLALYRINDKTTTGDIIKSLKERSLTSEEMGMYWKLPSGWYWYQHPIETQALMIELFNEAAKDQESVYQLKVWLLKNKQTNRWTSTKATANAVFALLKTGGDWLQDDSQPKIEFQDKKMVVDQSNAEPGTGYFKQKWPGTQVTASSGKLTVSNNTDHISWGSMYWQYWEDLDKVKGFKDTPLTMERTYYKQINTDKGPVLQPITDKISLNPGDLIKVKIQIRVDRSMEFVHLKDMRASGLEPISVLSQYKWQGGLGFYESTRDLATHFFMDYLPKGTFIFEYSLRATYKGNFSTG
ncbi:MAG: MG2 domain-containing protein, partial [Saprospiraceae bacterium]